MTVVTAINPDWRILREEIAAQALAACSKLHAAIDSASEAPPLDLGEALEDAANKYLDVFEEISARHRKVCQRECSV
jgi:hypothetical protein